MKLRLMLPLMIAGMVWGCGDDATKGGANNANNTNNVNNVNNANNANNVNNINNLPDDAIVTTSGPIRGTEEDGLMVFKGIPYAQPPVGELRFKPPEANTWDDLLEADAFGPRCPQIDTTSMSYVGEEDCLTLNVWAPADAEDAPVMVFIHGGGFVQGAGSLPLYDGASLASQGVVLVTLNYRVGALGFLATDALIEEGGTAGNYGIRDQVLALQWIRDNAAVFGGNAENVTIFGESAGGVSSCVHLGSAASRGLFKRAIIESGSGCGGWPDLDQDRPLTPAATTLGEEFMGVLDCDGDEVECLRALTPEALVNATGELGKNALGLAPFGPNVDGDILSDSTRNQVDGGLQGLELITGSNADEANVFTTGVPIPTEMAYENLVRAQLTIFADDVLAAYPASDFATPKAAYNAVAGDIAFVCPALHFAGAAADAGNTVYTYHFTHLLNGVGQALGAFHGLELAYVFGNLNITPAYTPVAADQRVSDEMQAAWLGFARNGDPGWPEFEEGSATIQIFDDPSSLTDEISEGRCETLRSIGLVP